MRRHVDWHGLSVAKTQPWGQGPVLLQTLTILDALDDSKALDPSSTGGIHAITEALKLSFADREAWYGDGQNVPLETLLSAEYASVLRWSRGGLPVKSDRAVLMAANPVLRHI